MPGLRDFLEQSVIPRRAIRGVQDAVDDPTGDYSDDPMMARLRGFGAGALEGAADAFTSPLGLATGALGGAGLTAALRGLKAAPTAVKSLVDVVPDVVHSAPIRQVMPSADDVTALLGDLRRNLAKVPNAGTTPPRGPNAAALQSMPAEFVGRGQEKLWNAARTPAPRPQDPHVAEMFQRGVSQGPAPSGSLNGFEEPAAILARLRGSRPR